MKIPLGRGLKSALSVMVGAGMLAGVMHFVGWRRTLAAVHALGADGIVGVLANVLLAATAWILCWWLILRSYGVRIPLVRIIGARMSGYAISYLTPTLYFGGEPVRALLVIDEETARATRIFATIVVERFLGGLSMISFVLIGGFYAIMSPALPWAQKRLLVAGVAFITFWITVGLIDFAGNFKWISRAIRMFGRLVPRWRTAVKHAADRVSETEDEIFAAFTRHWKATLLAFLVQVVATFLIYMRPQVFFHFASDYRFGFPQLSLLFTLSIMMSFFLWITPGGLGTGEAALIGIFILLAPGIAKEEVVAYSLIFKAAESLLVAGGLWYLAHRGFTRFGRRAIPPGS